MWRIFSQEKKKKIVKFTVEKPNFILFLNPQFLGPIMTWKKKVGKEKSVLVIIGNKQIHQFLHLEFLIPNECTYTEHAHPSIHPYIHPLYAHISSILQMSLTNWVKFQPKFDAQILHQTKWEREREKERERERERLLSLLRAEPTKCMTLWVREKREREREREKRL